MDSTVLRQYAPRIAEYVGIKDLLNRRRREELCCGLKLVDIIS